MVGFNRFLIVTVMVEKCYDPWPAHSSAIGGENLDLGSTRYPWLSTGGVRKGKRLVAGGWQLSTPQGCQPRVTNDRMW